MPCTTLSFFTFIFFFFHPTRATHALQPASQPATHLQHTERHYFLSCFFHLFYFILFYNPMRCRKIFLVKSLVHFFFHVSVSGTQKKFSSFSCKLNEGRHTDYWFCLPSTRRENHRLNHGLAAGQCGGQKKGQLVVERARLCCAIYMQMRQNLVSRINIWTGYNGQKQKKNFSPSILTNDRKSK